MKKICQVAAILATVAAAFTVAPAASAESVRFAAAGTEEFCAPGVTCGTASTRYGHATVRTVITFFAPLPSGCFRDEHTSTFTFDDGSTLVVAISGTLCPTNFFPNFSFTGTYEIVGGTGQFAGATGTGLVRALRENGPIHTLLFGTAGEGA